MDIGMPGLNGIEATRLICEKLPSVRVLMLSMYNSSEHSFRAVRSGAKGYILKEAPHETLLVLDATTGQNAHAQVDIFRQMTAVTGLVVTKLDGTARGGVLVAAGFGATPGFCRARITTRSRIAAAAMRTTRRI